MKVAFNDVNLITRKGLSIDCSNCCFVHKFDICFHSELRFNGICNTCYTLDTNIDDIFKL